MIMIVSNYSPGTDVEGRGGGEAEENYTNLSQDIGCRSRDLNPQTLEHEAGVLNRKSSSSGQHFCFVFETIVSIREYRQYSRVSRVFESIESIREYREYREYRE
jgi:hypothetical protein